MKLQKQKVAETKRQKVNPKAIMKSYSDKLQGELEVKGVDFFTPTDIDPIRLLALVTLLKLY